MVPCPVACSQKSEKRDLEICTPQGRKGEKGPSDNRDKPYLSIYDSTVGEVDPIWACCLSKLSLQLITQLSTFTYDETLRLPFQSSNHHNN